MEVNVSSRELIEPSSPTPPHLRTFGLSLLDHLVNAPVVAFILFYPSNYTGSDPLSDVVRRRLDLLKKSLSHTLSRFYPLASKIPDTFSVECDDGGACFIETSVNLSLSQFLADPPDLVALSKFIPGGSQYARGRYPDVTRCANIKVNVFGCGGIAIGICNPHILQDGGSVGLFLKEWAAAARLGCGAEASRDLIISPTKIFPPAEDMFLRNLFLDTFGSIPAKGKGIKQRFMFSNSSVEALRVRAMSLGVKNPTRVEAVSGFMWKCMMAASMRKNNGIGKPSVFYHLVDVRRRINPPLSEICLGNLLWMAMSQCRKYGSHCTDDVLPFLVGEMRKALRKIDPDFVSRIRQWKNLVNSFVEQIAGVVASNEDADFIGCSSWGHDTDFGWGSPVWVSGVGMNSPVYNNFVHLINQKVGGGMEAWVASDEPVLAILQEDPELRTYASVNPSPLVIGSML